MVEILRGAVDHGTLEMVPDELVGIELGCVAREALRLQARVLRQEEPDGDSAMRAIAVPQEDNRPADVPEQLPEELDDFEEADILIVMETGMEMYAPTMWRHGEHGECGDLRPVSGAPFATGEF